MVTSDEAQALIVTAIGKYLADCGCKDAQDYANALMKVASVAGLLMVEVVGQDEAVARMLGTAQHIAKPEFKED